MGWLSTRRFHRHWKRIIFYVVLLLVVFCLLIYSNLNSQALNLEPTLPKESIVNPQEFLQPAAKKVTKEAPWMVPKQSRVLIPKRLHHFFEDDGVPVDLAPEVTSWAKRNPDYQVFFWNARYVETHLLTMPEYKNYSQYYWRESSIGYERQLIARLLILYQYGGVIPELHMRALDSVTDQFLDSTCEMAQDRVEKAILMYNFEVLPTVSVLACQAKHPFLQFFLRKITNVSFRTGGRTLQVKTPQFIAHVYEAAVSAFSESCSVTYCDLSQRVGLSEPQIFMPLIELGYYESFVANCKSQKDADFLRKEACYSLEANGNKVGESSLAMPVYSNPWSLRPRQLLPFTDVADEVTPRHRFVGNWLVANETV